MGTTSILVLIVVIFLIISYVLYKQYRLIYRLREREKLINKSINLLDSNNKMVYEMIVKLYREYSRDKANRKK
jgi:uncharacterized membrane protein YcjF (UPF0283 family)